MSESYTERQSEALCSLGFDRPNSSQKTSNYMMNWEAISIDNMVNIVQEAFKTLGSPDDFELIVEN